MKPVLVAMKGHPATGKSTLGESMAKSLHWPLIDKDDARDCLSMMIQGEEQDAARKNRLAKQLNAISYDIMFRIAETQLRLGLGVIVVCPLAWPWLFHQCQSIARRNGVEMIIVECVCRDEILWKTRLEQRAKSALLEDPLPPQISIATDSSREAWADGVQSVFDASTSVWWHKPRTWEEHQKNVARYEGQCDYETGGVRKIVVDTSAGPCLDSILQFLAQKP
ncbi:hypothetical protein SELMODRAFT_422561 [Selaginella moellendorffii]|uniref:Zeta toxin domain-containing protein n=1 Tax=Selaginella moellendorffii TaxID=88036 RepID=D8SIU3_SELML|nr:hypothetical protein SELMODRAFT_422561 [Selaginella moellendorffii]